MCGPSLDSLIARARQAEVRPGPRDAWVAEAVRPAPARDGAGSWWRFAGGAGAALAAAAIVLLLVWPTGRATEPVRVGDRVALMAEPAPRRASRWGVAPGHSRAVTAPRSIAISVRSAVAAATW